MSSSNHRTIIILHTTTITKKDDQHSHQHTPSLLTSPFRLLFILSISITFNCFKTLLWSWCVLETSNCFHSLIHCQKVLSFTCTCTCTRTCIQTKQFTSISESTVTVAEQMWLPSFANNPSPGNVSVTVRHFSSPSFTA